MQILSANRNDFFVPGCCPIAVRTIQGDASMQHEGDLTDLRHTHDFAELIIITKGWGKHWINGELYEVSAGDVFLIQGNSEHFFEERQGLSMYNIMFDEFYLKPHLRSLRSLPGFNAFFLFEPTYRRRHKFQSRLHLAPEALFPLSRLLHQMDVESRQGNTGFDLILLSRALEIFVILSREYLRTQNPMARSLCRLGELITLLENEYRQNWTLAKVSKMVAMAPSTLLPVFRDVTGCSPIEYLLHVRLSKAAERLLKTNDTIGEIANHCGFADSNYFSRQFRKHYGCSPRQYRGKKTQELQR
jgi:AraC family L-rhamnose operon transcriptional activator RhaR